MKNTILAILIGLIGMSGCSDKDESTDAVDGGRAPVGVPSMSKVRVAHLSPDAPPIDFCFKAINGEVVGPVLERAGLTGGVAFGQVTPYLPSAEGTFTVQVIGAEALDCGPVLVEVPNVIVPGGGLEITTAAVGLTQSSDPGFELIFLLDENTPITGKAKVRFVHAAPRVGRVDVGILASASDVLGMDKFLFDSVAYKNTEQPPYATVEPLLGARLRAQVTDHTSVGVEAASLNLNAGQVTTAFAIGTGANLRLLVCDDLKNSGACSAP